MKQAKLDLKAALEFLPSSKNGPTFNWICLFKNIKCLLNCFFRWYISI
jgi:hypothetical protein